MGDTALVAADCSQATFAEGLWATEDLFSQKNWSFAQIEGREDMKLTSIEICAGAGGQALGLERAGFHHLALVEIEAAACETLLLNRPKWNVIQGDIHEFSGKDFQGVDLLAGGVPCPPFSKAGKQLGIEDERDLFPEALRLVAELQPRAVMIENVRGLLDPIFESYRNEIKKRLNRLGFNSEWRLLNAKDYGVPQLRPRAILVAFRKEISNFFVWPSPSGARPPTVGECLFDLMASNGWKDAESWRDGASEIAPTLVGGSKKHGGPDLGPTRAKKAWANLGVDGHGVANEVPDAMFSGMPKLTTRMTARLQGFPDSWAFSGKKTSAYRQIGNAFPPPVAHAVGLQIASCLRSATSLQSRVA
jgi:DNA (cytosine-5)-methyltransferase 1